MFGKVLVANRGEIALRIIRTCREMGIQTVAIFSEADRESLHVELADEAYCVGPGPSGQSYLNVPNIMSAAVMTGADAIHPGYGYLSEQAQFAEVCESHGVKFIGPSADVIERMGDKAAAKRAMKAAGVPVVPGSEGAIRDEAEAVAVAEEIGYPVIIKAASGGGGRGMRVAYSRDELLRGLTVARSEAEVSFGSDAVYIEKFVEDPRHIEVQILADEHGNCVHLFERECSLQRRHQKVIEEAPAVGLDDDLRKRMGAVAVQGAESIGYTNAGTIEFLLDRDGSFYFMEMNTRVQVEHPVTEWITGIDIVKEQIRIAAGEPLGYGQEDIQLRGHAIECRLNAESPEHGFRPSPGTIVAYHAPGGMGVRIDSAAFSGWKIPPYYDSMFGKLSVWGRDRQEAIAKIRAALDELVVEGIATNIEFQKALVDSPAFREGKFSTNFIEKQFLPQYNRK
ncbi:MAG: acetyl-CoA carboxylase biotin carboxylase subunit [Firmicutes bacterium]|nr:acetyl-CoA carboxylase biotin carboxylase subunit [Bacillota bacterium]